MSDVWERGISSRQMKPLFLSSNSLLPLLSRFQLGDEYRRHPLLAWLTRFRIHVSFPFLVRSSAPGQLLLSVPRSYFNTSLQVSELESRETKVPKRSSFAFRRSRWKTIETEAGRVEKRHSSSSPARGASSFQKGTNRFSVAGNQCRNTKGE